jgi:hypothetical protein
MARAVTDMFTVLADPKVAEPLKLRFGTKTLNLIVDQVKREAGLKDAQPQGMLGRISGQLYRPFAIKTLATRVTSYVNNRLGGAMSMATELAKLDPKAGTQFWNMARLMKPNAGFYLTDSNREIYNKLMQNGYLYARWAGDRTMTYGGALEDRETLKSEKKMWWRNLQNKALAPMAHAEAINAINAFKVLRNQGYTEERAVKMVEVLTRRTQNAATTLEDSALGIEMREKGYNLAVPFFNQTITQANMFFEDVIAWRGAKRKGDAAAQARAARNIWIDVRGLAAGSIALAGVSAIISLGRQGYPRADEKKKKKLQAQALINLVGGSAGRFADGIIPGASSLADNAARGLVQALEADEDKRLSAVQKAATGFFTDSGRAPMAQAAGNAQDLINQGFAIIKGHRQHKDLESWRIQKAMGDIEDLLTTAIGAPTGGTEQAGSFLYGAFTGQTWGRNPKKE